MRRGLALAAAGFLALGAGRAHAAAKAGAEPFDFLFLDPSARAVALGGAYTALANDANALHYNPAGLGRIRWHEATFMHNQHFSGVTQDSMGLALRQGLGLSLNYVRFGDIPRTTYSKPDGTLGTFGIQDLAVGAGYGRSFFDVLSLGVGVKHIRETIDNLTAQGWAADAGFLLRVRAVPGLTVGAALQNLGPNVRFQSKKERLPQNVRAGLAVVLPSAVNQYTVAVDATKERSGGALFGAGIEGVFSKQVAARAGFSLRNDAGAGVTAGVGWRGKSMALDYAIVPYGDLGLTHRVSFTVRWGKPGRREEPPPPSPLFPKGIRPDPETPEAHFARAEELRKANELSEALRELELGAQLLGPRDVRKLFYWERRGYVAWLRKDYDEAKELFEKGISLALELKAREPVVADLYAGLGFCLAEEKNIPGAIRAFQTALDHDPAPRLQGIIERQLERLRAISGSR